MNCNPEPSPIAESIAKRAQRDIEFVCRQLLRFAKMPIDEHMAYLRKHPNEAFCQIPRPDGKGHLQCGALAWEKLGTLAELALDLDRGLGRRVGRLRVRHAITDAFVKRVLQEAREVNLETAVLLLQDTLEALRQSLAVTEHYLPCVLFPGGAPDEFSVGPVTFTRRGKFFKDRKPLLRRSVEAETAAHIERVNAALATGFPSERAYSAVESMQLVRSLQARAIKTYRGYPWIASVKVTDCDKDTSQERGARAVEMALHIIRVLLGAEPTRKLRLAWSRSDALRTAHLFTDARGVIQASIGMNAFGPVGMTNWHEALMQGASELSVLGSALTPIVDPVEIHHLHQRLIDAINWFGDAAMDSNAPSSIVKYVSAIERLFFGKFESGRTKIFADRVKGVLDAFGCDEDRRVYEQALAVYKTRSALVHGAQSPSDDEVREMVYLAAALSRLCLLCSAQFYPMMLQAFGNPDPAKLEEGMKRISCEGLDWLEEASGCLTSVKR
ncbi:MAG: hypothetical protein HHJ15_14940 [Rhodoferax sp.]|uniref:HEPN domain-containing protein n=1 Tax=Rhodoferax sp. TaxID=50421 RepID=UPI0017CF48D8|nr:HEPN domain-containing protein [Rhodoferax sp.]NMM21227.1 hypothetical protein [Rhodoferax sp.]